MSEEKVKEETADVVDEPRIEDVAEAQTASQAGSGDGVETMAEARSEESVTEVPSLEEQLQAARAEAEKNLDGWLRAQAEFSNARKRMEKQRSEIYVNATADVVTKLLPILDDFGRALSDIPAEIAGHSWLEGMYLVQRKLMAILEGLKVTPIEAVGQPFDPNFHEAIMQEASDEFESGIVTKELQQGFQLGERVIRPALVYVAE